jgi:hypothetical protein
LIASIALLAVAAPASRAAVRCDKIASPTGSDRHGNGSHRKPFRTIHRLDVSLQRGQTGCLRAGAYGGLAVRHLISRSGTPSRRITIRAYPGEHAKLLGWVDIQGSYTRLSDFEIDGTNTLQDSSGSCGAGGSVALSIEGKGDTVERNDYYQSIPSLRGNGIGIGWSGSGDDTVIRHNRIHDVGHCRGYDHLIYLAHGRNVRIYGNWLWNDRHGWGVQIYPGPSGAHIYANVIVAAGSGFTVGGLDNTSDNRIDHNVIVNSTGLADAGTKGVAISDWWENRPGSNNTFTNNDSYHNPAGLAMVSAVRVWHNTTANPHLLAPRAHDFRVAATSRFRRWGLWDGGLGAAGAASKH